MLTARDARPEDYPTLAPLWAELNDDVPMPARDVWDALYQPYIVVLENAAGEITGYAMAVPYPPRADVRNVVVTPAWRRTGMGRELMDALATRLRAAGCTEWRLEVAGDNAAAIALYRRLGMEKLHDVTIVRLSRAVAERFAATRSGTLAVTEVDPADDARLEEWFDLARGQLARYRTQRPHAPMWRITDRALTHVTPDFFPDASLLFPFRAVDADHAATLIAAACEHGVRDELELLVIGQVATAALIAAGGRVHARMIEMRGWL